MNCPKCGMEMRRVGLAQVVGTSIFITQECPSCHYRVERQAKP